MLGLSEVNYEILQNLKEKVAAWSHKNFGDQQSKYDSTMNLKHLAPLMGIGEEIGELYQAESDTDVEDAIADIVIYLCDFCARFGIDIPEEDTLAEFDAILLDLTICYGDLLHAVLKTHQGIRGYDDKEFAKKSVTLAVARLLYALVIFTMESEIDSPEDLAYQVFINKIEKRDWVANPEGNEHA